MQENFNILELKIQFHGTREGMSTSASNCVSIKSAFTGVLQDFVLLVDWFSSVSVIDNRGVLKTSKTSKMELFVKIVNSF